MSEFSVGPPHLFASERESKATIKRPAEIAYFSYDEDHKFRLDDSSLKWYYTPKTGVSLSDGFDKFRKLDDSEDLHLDALLKTLIEKERVEGTQIQTDIVTWRGMMTKILTALYSDDSFEMNATLYQDTIYIEESHEFKNKERQRQLSQKQRPGALPQELMMYWGYKFETLSVIPSDWGSTPREVIENRPKEVVSNYAQHCSIVETTIGDTRLILAGEVDCIWDSRPMQPASKINWVELKTNAMLRSAHDIHRFEKKLNKFWAQSFLLGVPIIIVGFRSHDETGTLEHVIQFDTTKIPGMVRKSSQSWSSDACINFTAKFLAYLKSTIVNNGLWKVKRDYRSNVIRVFQVESGDYKQILSSEFLQWKENEQAKLPNTACVPTEADGSGTDTNEMLRHV